MSKAGSRIAFPFQFTGFQPPIPLMFRNNWNQFLQSWNASCLTSSTTRVTLRCESLLMSGPIYSRQGWCPWCLYLVANRCGNVPDLHHKQRCPGYTLVVLPHLVLMDFDLFAVLFFSAFLNWCTSSVFLVFFFFSFFVKVADLVFTSFYR